MGVVDQVGRRPYGRSVCTRELRGGALGWRLLTRALLVAMLWTVVGCGPDVRVKSSFDPNAELERYHTFAMLLPNKAVRTGPEVDPFAMQRLRQLTYTSLRARGFRAVPRAEAQLLVGVQAAVRGRVDVSPRPFSYGRYYGPAWGYPYGGYDVREYDEAIVVIDLVDAETNSVVWRGTGTRTVSGRSTDEQLRVVVDEILAQYPPDDFLVRGDE